MDDWLHETEVSAPERCFWCHPAKMHVIPLFPPKVGYSEKCVVLLSATFSLWASSHLIKQAQEMFLWVDWPCLFLWRPPSGTVNMYSVSLWQRVRRNLLSLSRYNSLSSYLSSPLTPIYLTPFLPQRNDYYNVHSHFTLLPLLASVLPPCPLFTSPSSPSPSSLLSSSPSIPKAKQAWLIKWLSTHLS